MNNPELSAIYQLILDRWEGSGAWPAYVDVMRQVLFPSPLQEKETETEITQWALLPSLSCQAAGGQTEWARVFSAAWLLFYRAADLMDSVEDQDPPLPGLAGLDSGAIINLASGLYFSASRIFNEIYRQDAIARAATEISETFFDSFLEMCSGQQSDLTLKELNLEDYWRIASAKSGSFFRLACWAGARIGTDDRDRLAGFSEYGHHLGMLIQVLDDLEEIQAAEGASGNVEMKSWIRSLPVVYTLEVLPEPEGLQLRELIHSSGGGPEPAHRALNIIERSGAALYISAEIDRYRKQACAALERAKALPEPKQKLLSFLNNLGKTKRKPVQATL